MSAAVDGVGDVSTNKLGLRIDAQQDAPTAKGTTPCATPKGYRAIELEINPSTWKPDLSKCKVCDVRFTWLNHRHKCRRCMEPVCNSCSKGRKALRAYTAPKRVCDTCIKNCWTPRHTTGTAKLEAADSVTKPAGDDDRRVSLKLSTSDANACPVDATATAPLSPGTPAVAGFFGLGCASPSAGAAAATSPLLSAAVEEDAGEPEKDAAGGSTDDASPPPSSSSSRPRRHRRQASAALSSLPLASPASSPSSTTTTMATAGKDGAESEPRPPSAGGSPLSSPRLGGARLAPFFGGRLGGRSRRESSAGRLESSTWTSERALGGGGDVDKAVAELERLQQQREEKKTGAGEGPKQGAEGAASSSSTTTTTTSGVPARPAVLPALPEEPADAATAAAAAAAEDVKAEGLLPKAGNSKAEQEEDDYDDEGTRRTKRTKAQERAERSRSNSDAYHHEEDSWGPAPAARSDAQAAGSPAASTPSKTKTAVQQTDC